jgi:hypothetical protein
VKDLSAAHRLVEGTPDFPKEQGSLSVLQVGHSAHPQREAGVLSGESVPVMAVVRLETVALPGAVVAGAAEAAAESLGSLG